jgi:hypothetical protein
VRQDVVTVGRYIEDTVTFDFELHLETMVRAHGSAGAREGNREKRTILKRTILKRTIIKEQLHCSLQCILTHNECMHVYIL